MILLNRQAGTTQGHYLIESNQGNIAVQTPSKSSLFCNESFTQLLPSRAHIGNYKTYWLYGDGMSTEFKDEVLYIMPIYRNVWGLKIRTLSIKIYKNNYFSKISFYCNECQI
jgi:hypothetical protein